MNSYELHYRLFATLTLEKVKKILLNYINPYTTY